MLGGSLFRQGTWLQKLGHILSQFMNAANLPTQDAVRRHHVKTRMELGGDCKRIGVEKEVHAGAFRFHNERNVSRYCVQCVLMRLDLECYHFTGAGLNVNDHIHIGKARDRVRENVLNSHGGCPFIQMCQYLPESALPCGNRFGYQTSASSQQWRCTWLDVRYICRSYSDSHSCGYKFRVLLDSETCRWCRNYIRK